LPYPDLILVENKKNGFLIKPNSSKAIQESVLKILETNNLNSMGDESRNIVIEKFSNEIIYSQFENVYSI
jgi:glycosyltransferase involved in cell wall biosynthesis